MKLNIPDYKERLKGKTIIAGEHAVLRGHPALIFPVHSQSVEFTYENQKCPFQLKILPNGPKKFDYHQFVSYMFKFFNLIDNHQVQGRMLVKFCFPVKSGLGGSACLSVALAKFFQRLGYLSQENFFDFSLYLENYFHGESSGADIAAVLEEKPIIFYREPLQIQHPTINWKPLLYLTPTGKKASTKTCIQLVQMLWISDPETAFEIDNKMRDSVDLCLKGLLTSKKHQLFKDWNRSSFKLFF